MKATAEKLENNTVVLQFEVDPENVSKAIDQAYRRLVKKVTIPGFRKGKTPRSVFERFVGKQVLNEEAVDILMPGAYFEAVSETGIEPVTQPELEIVQLEEGNSAIFKATVVVKPEVKLGDYKGIPVSKKVVAITESDVDKEIEVLRARYAKVVPIDDGQVQNGDFVTLDYNGKIDGISFEGGAANDYQLEIGSKTFIPGFEEQLIGMASSEQKEIKVRFPEDYPKTDLAGKEAQFDVAVKAIKRKELANVDDEFARDVSEFETLEALRLDILNRLKETAEKDSDRTVKSTVVDKAVESAKVEVPEVMVDNQVEKMLANFENQLKYQGISLDNYFKYTGGSIEDIKEKFRPDALKTVEAELVLEAIAKQENIEVEESEVDAELAKIAESYKQDAGALRQMLESKGTLYVLKNDIRREKTIKLMVDNASFSSDTKEESQE